MTKKGPPMFDTPQEAALKAEIARLRAENRYLRQAVEAPGRSIDPFAVSEEMLLPRAPAHSVNLPLVSSVVGRLQEADRWEVMAQYERNDKSTVRIDYFMPVNERRHRDDWSFLNTVLPKMHEKFIQQLADLYVREHRRD